MNRRNFLKGAAVATVAATVPLTLGAFKENRRTIQIDTEDGWKDIEMRYLKPGDVFRVLDNNKMVIPAARASTNPYIIHGDIWGIRVNESYRRIKS